MPAPPSATAGPVGPRSGSTGAAGPDRRSEILAIAAEIFARKGYVNATVREIADASGILAGSLYHHFDSKEAMVDEILSTFLRGLLADYRSVLAEGADPVATLRTLVHCMFRGMTENRAAITLANNDAYYLQQMPRFAYLQESGEQIAGIFTGVLRDGVEAGAFRADTDPALVWVFIKGAAWATVQYLSEGGGMATEAIADTYLGVLFAGIATS